MFVLSISKREILIMNMNESFQSTGLVSTGGQFECSWCETRPVIIRPFVLNVILLARTAIMNGPEKIQVPYLSMLLGVQVVAAFSSTEQ